MLIIAIVVGLALAVVAQAGARGSAALAAVTPVQGTDVSSLQGSSTSINWADVAGSERFVAVKATEGNYYTDPDYQADVTEAVAGRLGCPVAVELVENDELLKLGPPHKIPRTVRR